MYLSLMLSCKACGRSWNRESNLTQHFIKIKSPRCLQAKEERLTQLQASRYRSRPHPTARRFPSLRIDAAASTPTLQSVADRGDPAEPFAGDFFSEDYTAADFPGFEGHGDGSNHEGSDSEDDGDETSHGLAELEPHREPEHQPPSSAPPPSNIMSVDDADLPLPRNNPLLQKLLAH